MYNIGYDIGSSSVKVSLVSSETGKNIYTLHEPKKEMDILSIECHWAEQSPDIWWKYTCIATKKIIKKANIDASKILGIGISYQMHGLVIVDKKGKLLRDSIIWCDSRAVAIGKKAFKDLGEEKCTDQLLNSPGNFTASKLKWVRDNEPKIYDKIHKYMLPGDYIAYKLTGKINTTKNGLSEGILWNYKNDTVANWLLEYYGICNTLTPNIVENFTNQGEVNKKAFEVTGLPIGTPIVYRAGDQPNNALSLNIFQSGEVAVTGGTSGVIYAVTDTLKSKESSRINHFSHVNYTQKNNYIGKLLCVNGAGIMYRWLRDNMCIDSYEAMNEEASKIPIGSEGVIIIPFGNGAERMLNSKNIGTHFKNLNLNQHNKSHLCRAALEGIAFSFVYGMEILKNDHAKIDVIRAGNDNLFRSELFATTVATLIGHDIEIYNTTGAVGAARAVGLTDGDFKKFGKNISKNDYVMTYTPSKHTKGYKKAYKKWKNELEIILNNK
ncbi:carbohydrate kinase [Flavivirga aquatica]|uniref:Carbohydrate kinase n=1 Tax=Flavivirga aquatica TaxID=1849968 RepID=A0A1E5TBR4_9FLAO|nr:FGGY family carbohydrate kinase [Flavivirga aquatica]OEK08798.1 carbohydrate kinase [Flavivirga aquatica]